MRVLCLGYSVTEGPGYIDTANARAREQGGRYTFIRSGWGGHSINTLAYMAEEVLDQLPCDMVLLEPFTGFVRAYRPARVKLFLDEVLAILAARRLPVAMLALWQEGVDFSDDLMLRVGNRYRDAYGIPFLDLATVIARLDEGERAPMYLDVVHTTPLGSELYGNTVFGFVTGLKPSLAYARHFRARRRLFRTVRVPPLVPDLPLVEVKRNGIPLSFASIEEGVSARLEIGGPAYVEAAMAVFGPRSGRMEFDGGAGHVRSLVPYDRNSYYVRAAHIDLKIPVSGTLTVSQSAERPPIALLKGTPNDEPRRGHLSHVFLRRGGAVAYLAHHLLAWLFMTRLQVAQAVRRGLGRRGGSAPPQAHSPG